MVLLSTEIAKERRRTAKVAMHLFCRHIQRSVARGCQLYSRIYAMYNTMNTANVPPLFLKTFLTLITFLL
jgi:hypothetical protein